MLDNCEILLGMFDATAAASQRGSGSVIHEPEPVHVVSIVPSAMLAWPLNELLKGGSRGLYPRRRTTPTPRYVRPGFVHEDFVEGYVVPLRY